VGEARARALGLALERQRHARLRSASDQLAKGGMRERVVLATIRRRPRRRYEGCKRPVFVAPAACPLADGGAVVPPVSNRQGWGGRGH
jgi:hypothetical protein